MHPAVRAARRTRLASSAPSGAAPDMIVAADERSTVVDQRMLGERERDRRHDVGARDAVLLRSARGTGRDRSAASSRSSRRRDRPQVHDHDHPVDVEERQHADQPSSSRRSADDPVEPGRGSRPGCGGVSITPFGSPVVPLEYGQHGEVRRRGRSRPPGGSPARRSSVREWRRALGLADDEDLLHADAAAAATSRASSSAGTVTSIARPESRSWCASSSAV